jgi:hypothetical protein
MASGLYVYAIVRNASAPLPGLLGFDDAPLEAVPCRDLAAVTSALDSGYLRPTIDHILRHEAIVEAVREQEPALPVRFGTVLAGRAAVEREVESRHDALACDLARLGDTAEFGLVVLWEPADREARSETPDPHVSGARYLETRRDAFRRESQQREHARALAGDLHAILGPHALDHRAIILPTARLALRATYLVKRDRVEHLRAAFEEARRRHPELRLLLSGPWPPYTFVTAPAEVLESAEAGV